MFYQIADISFRIEGDALTEAVARMDGFATFATEEKGREARFTVRPKEADEVPAGGTLLYADRQYGVRTGFYALPAGGYLLDMQHEKGDRLRLWSTADGTALCLAGTPAPQLLRFALWTGYGVMTARSRRIAMHGSCIVARGEAYLFLGESGTGKSTHTRLWQEHVPGSTLLNDDSPIVWAEDGEVWAYGSPWSGKTPCYKPERYLLRGCVRLAQAPCNRMTQLTGARAYAALHPSCPPAFAYDSRLYDTIGETLAQLLDRVPVYWLECRPDREAALLSFHTLCHE